MTPRQALQKAWRGLSWPHRMTSGEVADVMLAALRAAGYEVSERRAIAIDSPPRDVTAAPGWQARCWSCDWRQFYALRKDALAQGKRHRCPTT